MINPEELNGTERNAKGRQILDSALTKIPDRLLDRYPDITANHITGLGFSVTALSLALETKAQRPAKENRSLHGVAVVLYLVGQALDKLDGVWARAMVDKGIEVDGALGEKVDTLADRLTELLVSLSHVQAAKNREDTLGMVTGLAAAATNNLSSLTRAAAAAEGKAVPETGTNPLQFFGTRLGRSISGGIGAFIPELTVKLDGQAKKIPVQAILDAISVVTTLNTALSRYKIAHDPEAPVVLPAEQQKNARERLKLMKMTMAFSLLASAAYAFFAWRRNFRS